MYRNILRMQSRLCMENTSNRQREITTSFPKLATQNNGLNKNRCNYDMFINEFSKRRKPSILRELAKVASDREDLLQLAAGYPDPATCPITEMSFKINDNISINLTDEDLHEAMQYKPSGGYPPLLKTLKELQQTFHQPPCWDDLDVIVTPGSQDGLSRVVEMVLEYGDPILVQQPTYTGMVSIMEPFNPEVIAIDEDEKGLRADLMREVLEKRRKEFLAGVKEKRLPKLLYVNSTGANPSGITISTERKKEIYKVASEYNLIILEDDPYYYVHFEKEYPVSFLSLDTEGRVVRFDSFSKVIAPGLRLGFTTGAKKFIRQMDIHIQSSCLQTATLCQVITHKILKAWDKEGFLNWCKFTQSRYKERRDVAIRAAEKYLTGLAEWNVPAGGMFLWVKITALKDVHKVVTKDCLDQGVLLTPGHPFTQNLSQCQYVRICYSLVTLEQLDHSIKTLADAIKIEISKNSDKD